MPKKREGDASRRPLWPRATMYHFLGAEHRARLKEYRYASQGSSLVSTYVLGPYWNWLVTLFPLSIAPNTLTLSGLLLVVANYVSLLFLDGQLEKATQLRAHTSVQDGALPTVLLLPGGGLPDALRATQPTTESPIPSWMLFVWAICLFLYQSMDAIDGKQARRTGMAGPLGELFDHGCDALNTMLEVVLAASALGFGRSYWTLICLISSLTSFFLTTWEEYHTHVLFLSSFSGPVEGILIICALYTCAGAFGSGVFVQGVLNVLRVSHIDWVRTHIAWANVPLGDLVMLFACLGLLVNAWQAYRNVRGHCRSQHMSTLAPLAGLVPFVIQIVSHMAWASGRDAQVMVHGHLFMAFLMTWGLSFAYLVGLVILAHVCRTPYPYWNVFMLPSMVLGLDAWLPQPILQATLPKTVQCVYYVLGLTIAGYAYFVYDVIRTITTETGKPCFRVVKAHEQ